MKIKVSEATGSTLDWLVAKAENLQECIIYGKGTVKGRGYAKPNKHGGSELLLIKKDHNYWVKQCDNYPWRSNQKVWCPSTDWSQSGPIIEREAIGVAATLPGEQQYGAWEANPHHTYGEHYGPTPLIAAMRCYVASKLGEEVEVPDEFKES